MAQTNVMVLLQQINVTVFCTSTLTRHIREPITCSGRNTDCIWKTNITIHQIVKHATSKYSPHTSTFKHQSGLIVKSHSSFLFAKITNEKNISLQKWMKIPPDLFYSKRIVSISENNIVLKKKETHLLKLKNT